MYHRAIGEDEDKYTAAVIAEKLRMILSRATVLLVVLMAAPYLYGVMTGGNLNHLAGADQTTWETMQWALTVSVVFVVIGLIGVARMGVARMGVARMGVARMGMASMEERCTSGT